MTEEVRLADNTYRVKAANWNLSGFAELTIDNEQLTIKESLRDDLK